MCEDTVDARAHPGSVFRLRLKSELAFGSPAPTQVAPAGAPAQLVILARDVAKDGSVRYTVAVNHFRIGTDVGDLPVALTMPVVGPIPSGTEFAATTKGAVAFDETGRLRIAIPLPFVLSHDAPNGSYTPVPLRTPEPIHPKKRPTPTPSPSDMPSAPPSPLPSAS